jgi:hypothetical protein
MKERKVDLFETIYEDGVDAICIATNSSYTKRGIACMGGGSAGTCAQRWPQTAQRLGKMLQTFGTNVPFVIGAVDRGGKYLEPDREMIRRRDFKCLIFSFPTINRSVDGANLQLIKQSATIMMDYAEQFHLKGVVIGRPGGGHGRLDYSKEVKPAIESILDDRFTVVSFEHEE